MATELRWVASSRVSCFHAAATLIHGRPTVQPDLAAALAEPADALRQALLAVGAPIDSSLEHLVPLSGGIESNRELAEVALAKAIGAGGAADVGPLSAALIDLNRAQEQVLPKLLDELELRAGPLREQWEARGPGLLAGIARSLVPDLLVPAADVFVVYPIQGGGGEAHLRYNSVRIEAVLANPIAELPEVVRLAWLVSMLNLDLPKYSENLQQSRVVLPLAMLPAVLQAAANVELVQETVGLACVLDAWGLECPAGVNVPETLGTWWQTYCEGRPPLGTALVALERMLFPPL